MRDFKMVSEKDLELELNVNRLSFLSTSLVVMIKWRTKGGWRAANVAWIELSTVKIKMMLLVCKLKKAVGRTWNMIKNVKNILQWVDMVSLYVRVLNYLMVRTKSNWVHRNVHIWEIHHSMTGKFWKQISISLLPLLKMQKYFPSFAFLPVPVIRECTFWQSILKN